MEAIGYAASVCHRPALGICVWRGFTYNAGLMQRLITFTSLLSPRAKGVAYVMFAILVWSGWMILSRYSVRGSLTAYDITALRFGVAGVILLPVLLHKGLRIGPYGWKGGFFLALMMGAPYNTIAIAGMHYAPASHAAAIINTVMLTITTLAGIWVLKEKTSVTRMGGVLLSIAGIGCMLYASQLTHEAGNGVGSALFMVAGAMWAAYTVCMRAWHADPLHATAIVCSLSLIFYLPVYVLFIPSHIGMGNLPEVLFQAVYQGVINSVLALLCFNRGIRLLGATTTSAFLPLVFIFSTLLAIPLLQEVPGALEWTGIALASSGVFLATGIIGTR
jgi:drug/metabolite transporter (DMT)-like permease